VLAAAASGIGAAADPTVVNYAADRPAMIRATMGRWEIVFGAREVEPNGREDVTVCWAYELERGGERRTLTVEVTRAAAIGDKSMAPDDVRRALTTRGSSAVMEVLDRDQPPRKLLVDTHGIDELG
jgi:hypothetical protein